MASLADLPELIGFFSYAREDDIGSHGALSALRERIQHELRAQLGRTFRNFRLWQDKEAIAPGELWEREIKSAIEQAVFFIPIITPTVVKSPFCKSELDSFLARERALGRSDLVFPMLYLSVPALEDEAERGNDPVISLIAQRQYVDWRELRYEDVNTAEMRRAIAKFCASIAAALRKPWLTPEERQRREVAEARQRADEGQRQQEEERQRKAAAEAERLRVEREAAATHEAEERAREAAAVEAERQRTEREVAAVKREAEEKAREEERRKKQEDERRRREEEGDQRADAQRGREEGERERIRLPHTWLELGIAAVCFGTLAILAPIRSELPISVFLIIPLAIGGLSVSFLMRKAGIVSAAQAVFFGAGGLAYSVISNFGELSKLTSIPVALALALTACIVSCAAMSMLRGIYGTVAGFVVAESSYWLVSNLLGSVGTNGIMVPGADSGPGLPFAYASLVLLAIVYAGILISGRRGRIGSPELLDGPNGSRLPKFKTRFYYTILCGLICAIAGAYWAATSGIFVVAYFKWTFSIYFLVIGVLGGWRLISTTIAAAGLWVVLISFFQNSLVTGPIAGAIILLRLVIHVGPQNLLVLLKQRSS
jgi:ABC-type branched-subunit amino acid transport system permease subunit